MTKFKPTVRQIVDKRQKLAKAIADMLLKYDIIHWGDAPECICRIEQLLKKHGI